MASQGKNIQLKNKQKAMKVLKARLYDFELKKHNDQISAKRKLMLA